MQQGMVPYTTYDYRCVRTYRKGVVTCPSGKSHVYTKPSAGTHIGIVEYISGWRRAGSWRFRSRPDALGRVVEGYGRYKGDAVQSALDKLRAT